MSRVAKRLIDLPTGVTVSVAPGAVTVKGAKGALTLPLARGVSVVQEDKKLEVGFQDAGLGAHARRRDPRAPGEHGARA